MTEIRYLPEGYRLESPENREYLTSQAGLEKALREGRILESTVLLCDNRMRLHVDLYGLRGIVEREDTLYARPGETVKDIAILTRVGKPICFKVRAFGEEEGQPVVYLSRRAAQIDCARSFLADLIPGDLIPARVTHLEPFGAFVDIGCGIPSLLSVDCISVSRIAHPRDRLLPGDRIWTVVKSIDRETGRIYVSQRELYGTWEENAARFSVGQTAAGTVRSIEPYGIFVELAPNLAGLAELRPDASDPRLRDSVLPAVGQTVAVYIKSMFPERMKIKLVLIEPGRSTEPPHPSRRPPRYFIDPTTTRHIDRWTYSPPDAHRLVESRFDEE